MKTQPRKSTGLKAQLAPLITKYGWTRVLHAMQDLSAQPGGDLDSYVPLRLHQAYEAQREFDILHLPLKAPAHD